MTIKNTDLSENEVKSEVRPLLIREPAVAGAFYEGDPEKLRADVDKYISDAPLTELPGTLIGLMLPHAGYIYSGPVAGYGFKLLQGRQYKTVFVLAPSHRARFPGVSVIPAGLYRTPLGDVPVDEDMVRELAKKDLDLFGFYPGAHQHEHSLEVQVPFLQRALKEGWKIVPVVYGQGDLETCAKVAGAIASVFDPREMVVVASSDMSHFYKYEDAVKKDMPALEIIGRMDLEAFANGVDSGKCELCGSAPVVTLMILTLAMKGKASVLKYANSGDTAGDRSRVVGYGSVAFYTEKTFEKPEFSEEESKEPVDFTVSEDDRKMLLQMAKETLEEKIRHNLVPSFSRQSELLDMELGLFVTLRKQPGDMLRGCIGHCSPVMKLRDALPELTVSSATGDPRFNPVQEDELDDITIEISLLSPMRRISDWREIRIPGHGVYVKKGYRAGVFLPQVADETGWDRETFMAHLCRDKAGLPADQWKKEDTELFVFTALKIEEDMK